MPARARKRIERRVFAFLVLALGLTFSCGVVSNSEVADQSGATASTSASERGETGFSSGGVAARETKKTTSTYGTTSARGGNTSAITGGSTSSPTPSPGTSTIGGASSLAPSRGDSGMGGGATPESVTNASGRNDVSPPEGDDCIAGASWTEAVRFVLKTTWDATSAGLAGSADIEVMMLVKLTANGTDLVGTARGCRTSLPPVQLNAAGQLVTGGSKMLTDIPDSVWDSPTMGTADCKGTLSGSGPTDAVEYGFSSLIGLSLNDPNGAWPASGVGLKTDDVDGDGNPGFTSTPKNGGGYVLPPTGLGVLGSAPTADKVYIVSRNIIKLAGSRTSCDEHSGKAVVSAFDNHVVGCHTKSGSCTSSQVDFCDQNRPLYKVGSATYAARRVPNTATCADVRGLFAD